jgi:hypothetical protein
MLKNIDHSISLEEALHGISTQNRKTSLQETQVLFIFSCLFGFLFESPEHLIAPQPFKIVLTFKKLAPKNDALRCHRHSNKA